MFPSNVLEKVYILSYKFINVECTSEFFTSSAFFFARIKHALRIIKMFNLLYLVRQKGMQKFSLLCINIIEAKIVLIGI